jgi:hypothetical protein
MRRIDGTTEVVPYVVLTGTTKVVPYDRGTTEVVPYDRT